MFVSVATWIQISPKTFSNTSHSYQLVMKPHSDGDKRHEVALFVTDRQVDFNGAV